MERITRPAWGITLTLLFFLTCGFCRPANASVVYVNKASTAATHDGKTWGTAFTTVQSAISSAKSGDEVWVAAGTYTEAISLKANVPLYGGFNGTETDRNQRDWKTNFSILDGGNGGSTQSVVTFDQHYGDGPAGIDGLTVRNGRFGVEISNSAITISNCVISGNAFGIQAVGFLQPLITNCTISGNTSMGVVAGIASPTIVNSVISGSSIGVKGCANLRNCTISGNGTGIRPDEYGFSGIPTVTNCIISGNGTGIVNDFSLSEPDVVLVTLSHNDVFGNTTANFGHMTDATGTNGNISQDPKLSGLFGSVHLQPGSPCIDAGDDSLVTSGETDVYGKARIIGSHVDIGSDESDGTTWPSIPSHTWYVAQTGDDANDGSSWAAAKKTVAAGLSLAWGTDEVWVARGTYYESIVIPSGVALYGGFSGTESSVSERKLSANPTILDGGAGSTVDVVTTGGNECTVDGFTVQDGNRGIYEGSGTTKIANCTVTKASSAIVAQAPVDIRNCVITTNSGGIGLMQGGTVTNCTIVGNTNTGLGCSSGAVTIDNCVIAFNGIGVYLNEGASLPAMSFTDVFGNTTIDFYNFSSPVGANGNISADPLFAARARGDLRLTAGSPCVDAGDDSKVPSGSTDLDGRPRLNGAHVDMGAYEYRSLAPWIATLNTSVSGGVTVAEEVAYVAGGDGKLYARSTTDGSAVSGFPVDINAAVGATVKLPSRPAVYYGKTGKAIYLTTDRGDVVRVLPDGTVAWHVRPLTGQTVSTPAVTPDGYVFVNLSTGSGPFNNFVFKLDEATGTPLTLSPFLGYTTADNIGDFSPAVNNRYLYVNSGWGSGSGLTLLNQDNLAVRSSFAGGEQCLSPMLLGADLILATRGGKAYKVNAVTMNPDLGFGHFGVADIGSPISAAPFSDAAGNVYLGTAAGRILRWTPGAGAFQPFYATTGRVAGLTINRTAGLLGFGTSNGSFVQVPLDNPAGATTVTPGGPVSTGTVYESLTDRFIVVTDTGVLSGYPSVR